MAKSVAALLLHNLNSGCHPLMQVAVADQQGGEEQAQQETGTTMDLICVLEMAPCTKVGGWLRPVAPLTVANGRGS